MAPILAAGVVVAAIATLFAPSTTITGRAEIVDGDTLRIAGTRIRLVGLDAPELRQTCTDATGAEWNCGTQARAFLAGLAERRTLTCVSSGRDVYGRALAKCVTAGGDLGSQIVAGGWAINEAGYASEAATAQSSKRGIWSGSFVAPAVWRRTHGDGSGSFWDWIGSWFRG